LPICEQNFTLACISVQSQSATSSDFHGSVVVTEIALGLDQVFRSDDGTLPKIGVQATVLSSSGLVRFIRGLLLPVARAQDTTVLLPFTLQGLLLVSHSDQTDAVARQIEGSGNLATVDSGVQRFSRQQARYVAMKVSAPATFAGGSYTAQARFDDASNLWTKVDLVPQWDFLTGATGTLQGEKTTWAMSFFQYT
jgi:hypothetical protein